MLRTAEPLDTRQCFRVSSADAERRSFAAAVARSLRSRLVLIPFQIEDMSWHNPKGVMLFRCQIERWWFLRLDQSAWRR
jgi:hypothetical protein